MKKRIKAYAVLNPDTKKVTDNAPTPQFAVFPTIKDARAQFSSWPLVPCTITYEV